MKFKNLLNELLFNSRLLTKLSKTNPVFARVLEITRYIIIIYILKKLSWMDGDLAFVLLPLLVAYNKFYRDLIDNPKPNEPT